MGYAVYYGERDRILRLAFWGPHTDEIIRDAVTKVEAFQLSHPVEIGILDFSEVTSIETSPAMVRDVALGPRHYRRYFLVAPDAVQYGFSRMFQTLRGGGDLVNVMRNITQVYEQLSIAPSDLKLVASSPDTESGKSTS